ncbi:MAG: RNA methyltransferase [Oscillospiraceae bacterium]|nr:RNA methyltransferase [Oscillospiraceae bacterium]
MPQWIPLTQGTDSLPAVYTITDEVQLLRMNEPNPGVLIAESPKVIARAMRAGYVPLSFLMTPAQAQGESAPLLAACPADTPVYLAEDALLSALRGYPMTRGALALMQRRPLPDAAALCAEAHRIAILEQVVNPTNIGAMFRNAAALGVDAVLLTQSCCDPLYRRAARVSMGTVFQIPWTYLPDVPTAAEILRPLGFRLAAMALREDAISLQTAHLKAAKKLAILFGAEGDGLSEAALSVCDDVVMIPMSHEVDSLNVAASSAIAFWELGKQNTFQ